MVRERLERFPEFPLPAGFSIRWYQAGDEEVWLQIHRSAERLQSVTPELFGQQFGSDAALLSERQCYLVATGGEAIGTATAWFNDDFEGARFGRVHWVAVTPDYQGRGLARPLLTAVCRRLQDLGHDRAYLTTSAARVAAIKLYRRFGFVERN